MPRKRPTDPNRLAKQIIDEATSDKNPAAVALGRLGGLKGGKARADKLSKAERSEIAKKTAAARWADKLFTFKRRVTEDAYSIHTKTTDLTVKLILQLGVRFGVAMIATR